MPVPQRAGTTTCASPGCVCAAPTRGGAWLSTGARLSIHHNTLVPSYVAVCIRGVPEESAEVHHNWFVNTPPDVEAVRTDGRTETYDDLYEKTVL